MAKLHYSIVTIELPSRPETFTFQVVTLVISSQESRLDVLQVIDYPPFAESQASSIRVVFRFLDSPLACNILHLIAPCGWIRSFSSLVLSVGSSFF